MKTRRIGSLEVSEVGLGTNNFGFWMEPDAVAPVVDAALDAGITFFDTADSYGESERRLRDALGGRRDQVVIATKFGSATPVLAGGASAEYLRAAVERSLAELGTDRIDLYQLHKPDPSTPIAETLGALAELVQAGKVREIGCSNFSAEQLREAEAVAGSARFVSVQNQYSLVQRADEAEVLPTCRDLDIAYVPYSPLASGLLTGKYTRGQAPPPGTRFERIGERAASRMTDEAFDAVDRLSAWAADHGHTILDLAVAWLLANPAVASVIAGATKPSQVAANVRAGEWELTPAEVAEVNALAAE